jgi:hypothetical protein
VSSEIGGNLPLKLKPMWVLGIQFANISIALQSYKTTLFQAKVIVFQAKRERQEYPSTQTASTHV